MRINSQKIYSFSCTEVERESLKVVFSEILKSLSCLLDNDEKIIDNSIEYTKNDIENMRCFLSGVAYGAKFEIED